MSEIGCPKKRRSFFAVLSLCSPLSLFCSLPLFNLSSVLLVSPPYPFLLYFLFFCCKFVRDRLEEDEG